MQFTWIFLPPRYVQYLEGRQMPASILSDHKNNCSILLFRLIDLVIDTFCHIHAFFISNAFFNSVSVSPSLFMNSVSYVA